MSVLAMTTAFAASVGYAATNNVDLVSAARKQIGVTVRYVPDYQRIAYPKLVHEDMKANFAKYPQNWGLKKTDTNIDHRRVPNLQCYFKRKGYVLKATTKANDYSPGDFVTCTVAGRLPHIMLVSDRRSKDGTPLVIHNIGRGAWEEDSLFAYPITGHYRMK